MDLAPSPHAPTDRSRDLSQPLDRLGPDETLKADSDQLRGTIARCLAMLQRQSADAVA